MTLEEYQSARGEAWKQDRPAYFWSDGYERHRSACTAALISGEEIHPKNRGA